MTERFYNTTDEDDNTNKVLTSIARKQDDIILDYFRNHPDDSFTPEAIHYVRFDEKTPITSVRRSITNLTAAGRLEKTDEKQLGVYGRMNYKWKYRKE